jgi:uncharacterized oligopeptide transporter (OPT) family protein
MSQRTAPSSLVPRLALFEWVLFAVLAGVLASTNIYTTLLIGWGDTGSIVAVLASVAVLGIFRRRSGIYQINLGQTMASAGGSVGFAAACYASLYIVDPTWSPNPYAMIGLFAGAGILGALVGTAVRKQMVQYFFPSGTACAVIQRAVVGDGGKDTGANSRPVWLLKVWGLIAMALAIPTKISLTAGAGALFAVQEIKLGLARLATLPIGVDPLYYGIGLVVGPRVGIGMIIGALLPVMWIEPLLLTSDGSPHPYGALGDWKRWVAIAVLTLPTFATIVFAYVYRTTVATPPGFNAGATTYIAPPARKQLYGVLGVFGVGLAALCGNVVFGLPWIATIATIALAFPLSIVNGRVTGDTDINPVRLVAIVLISAFFWLVAKDAAVLLGMAVVGATVASVAVDMMTDLRTGHLLDQDSGHQSFVQVCGVIVGSLVAVPVLSALITKFGIGEGSVLAAPGSQVWAAMAKAMAGGVSFTPELVWAIVGFSAIGVVYAWLTVWPKSARHMPSLFGIGIGMLLSLDVAMAMFLGGVIKAVALWVYARGKSGDELAEAKRRGGDDTMVVGASVFAAAAVLSIGLVVLDIVFGYVGWQPWYLAH